MRATERERKTKRCAKNQKPFDLCCIYFHARQRFCVCEFDFSRVCRMEIYAEKYRKYTYTDDDDDDDDMMWKVIIAVDALIFQWKKNTVQNDFNHSLDTLTSHFIWFCIETGVNKSFTIVNEWIRWAYERMWVAENQYTCWLKHFFIQVAVLHVAASPHWLCTISWIL